MNKPLSKLISYALLLACSSFLLSCTPAAEQRICFFGSSVCRGVGADSLQGYAVRVTKQLPKGWETINISVDGNCTWDLFARFERDLVPTEAKYVVLGISLGNEGLHELGGRALLSYRENMPRLIKMLHDEGREVIVVNNYPRADFNATDYEDLCTVNLEVQEWDVTSINVCGTIDDGHGRWAEGYWNGSDIYHPNQYGHEAMASAFPPSLWAALQKGKALPEYVNTSGDVNAICQVSFVPEGKVASYTLSYTSADSIYTEVYSAAQKREWHYVNGREVYNSLVVNKDVEEILIEGENIHQVFFYRAAMTPIEVQALAQGKMLRSSLEIYCPLLGGDISNYAQTMNCVTIHNK